MSCSSERVRSIILDEGIVDWIMERETPEERLAAWDVLVALAFPEDESTIYEPPKKESGKQLSAVDIVRRDAYHVFRGIGIRQDGRVGKEVTSPQGEEDAGVANDNSSHVDFNWRGHERPQGDMAVLTKEEQAQISEWVRKFPTAASLLEYLKQNYFAANRSVVCTTEFSQYAYWKLKGSGWKNPRTKKPLKKIDLAIHYMALEYVQRTGDIRRLNELERQKDKEVENDLKSIQYSRQEPSEIAAIERKRRRAAEKEAMAKILKGEQF